jgi:hypothetical protein
MRRFSMDKIGAGLGIATGVAALFLAIFGSLFLSLFGYTGFGGTHAIKPLIGPGWSSVLYAITILASGLFVLRRPPVGAAGLILCALIGLLFGTGKYLIVECLSVIAGLLCFFGWRKRRSAPPLTN